MLISDGIEYQILGSLIVAYALRLYGCSLCVIICIMWIVLISCVMGVYVCIKSNVIYKSRWKSSYFIMFIDTLTQV